MRRVIHKEYRSVYPKPWASPPHVSKVFGINPGELTQARKHGIIQEGVYFQVVKLTAARKRLFVYGLDLLREQWPQIDRLLRGSYTLGRRQFREAMMRMMLSALVRARIESDPESDFD